MQTLYADKSLFISLQVCVLMTNVSCANEVNGHYYSSRAKFPQVCYVCGTQEELHPIDAEMWQQFQSIHPTCDACRRAGYRERTRNRAAVGGKKKK